MATFVGLLTTTLFYRYFREVSVRTLAYVQSFGARPRRFMSRSIFRTQLSRANQTAEQKVNRSMFWITVTWISMHQCLEIALYIQSQTKRSLFQTETAKRECKKKKNISSQGKNVGDETHKKSWITPSHILFYTLLKTILNFLSR